MTQAKFHTNPSTGVSGQCKATVECPFGGEHFDTIEEAQANFESKHASFEELKKDEAPAPSSSATATAVKAATGVKSATVMKAQAFATSLTSLRAESPEFFEQIETISSIGAHDSLNLSRMQEGIMQRTLASAMSNNSPQDKVAMDLSELRTVVEELDPNARPTGFMGAIRASFGGSKMKSYFRKFESSGSQLEAIVEALDSGKDALMRDNIEIKSERANLWKTLEGLEETEQTLTAMSDELQGRISTLEATDPEAAEMYKTEVLVPIQQKHQDVLTEIAVAKHGYHALDMIRKNNVSLMQTVDRTSSTTVAALRTAIVQSHALDSQKRVIEQAKSVQNMTSDLLTRSSADLRSQSIEINKSMNDPVVATKAIQESFANLYATIDEAKATKAKASEEMVKTIELLKAEVAKTEQYLGEDA